MDRLRNFRKLAAITLVLAGLVLLSSPLVCQGAYRVRVMNSADSPVPMVLTNPQSNPVPMVLTNPTSNPVPMMDVFSLGQVPVTQDFFFHPAPVSRYDIYTVPAEKRLVIEYLSHRTTIAAGDLPRLQLIVNTGGGGHFIEVPLAKIGSVGGIDYYSGGGPVKIYADPESTVTLQTDHIAPGNGPDGLITICGYLADVF